MKTYANQARQRCKRGFGKGEKGMFSGTTHRSVGPFAELLQLLEGAWVPLSVHGCSLTLRGRARRRCCRYRRRRSGGKCGRRGVVWERGWWRRSDREVGGRRGLMERGISRVEQNAAGGSDGAPKTVLSLSVAAAANRYRLRPVRSRVWGCRSRDARCSLCGRGGRTVQLINVVGLICALWPQTRESGQRRVTGNGIRPNGSRRELTGEGWQGREG